MSTLHLAVLSLLVFSGYTQPPTPPVGECPPFTIQVGINLIDVVEVASVDQTITLRLDLVTKWSPQSLDSTLACHAQHNLSSQLTPQTPEEIHYIIPSAGTIDYISDVSINTARTQRTRVQRVRLVLYTLFDFTLFPFDSHAITLELSTTMETHEAQLEKLVEAEEISGSADKAAKNLREFVVSPDFTSQITTNQPSYGKRVASNSCLYCISAYQFHFTVTRQAQFFIWNYFLPVNTMVFASCTGFWMDVRHLMPRVATSFISTLTLQQFQFNINSKIPQVAYQTWINIYQLVTLSYVFFAVLENVGAQWLSQHFSSQFGTILDAHARFGFPISWLIAQLILFVAYEYNGKFLGTLLIVYLLVCFGVLLGRLIWIRQTMGKRLLLRALSAGRAQQVIQGSHWRMDENELFIVFQLIDKDRSGWVSLSEVAKACRMANPSLSAAHEDLLCAKIGEQVQGDTPDGDISFTMFRDHFRNILLAIQHVTTNYNTDGELVGPSPLHTIRTIHGESPRSHRTHTPATGDQYWIADPLTVNEPRKIWSRSSKRFNVDNPIGGTKQQQHTHPPPTTDTTMHDSRPPLPLTTTNANTASKRATREDPILPPLDYTVSRSLPELSQFGVINGRTILSTDQNSAQSESNNSTTNSNDHHQGNADSGAANNTLTTTRSSQYTELQVSSINLDHPTTTITTPSQQQDDPPDNTNPAEKASRKIPSSYNVVVQRGNSIHPDPDPDGSAARGW